MFHDESWNLFIFDVKLSKVKVTSHENIADVGRCTLVGAGLILLFMFVCWLRTDRLTFNSLRHLVKNDNASTTEIAARSPPVRYQTSPGLPVLHGASHSRTRCAVY